MVSLFGFELKKKEKRVYPLEDVEVQEIALNTRRNNTIAKALHDLKMDEINHLKKLQDIRHNEEENRILEAQYNETLQNIYGADDEDDEIEGFAQTPEGMFMELVQNVMNKNKPQAQQPQQQVQPVQKQDFTDEQINEYLEQVPKSQLANIKAYDVDTQKELIKSKVPNISDASLNKIINLLS